MTSPPPQPGRLPLLLALPYALYALILFLVVALTALVLILPLGSLRARRTVVRAAARVALALVGIRLHLLHPERLPPGPCIVVANHASYLDGVVLKAALPALTITAAEANPAAANSRSARVNRTSMPPQPKRADGVPSWEAP